MSLKTFLFATLPALVSAAPKGLTVKTLGQLPAPSFFENVAIRPSGAILSTALLPSADIWTVTNPSSSDSSFELAVTIPEIDFLTGIAEVLDEDGQGVDKYIVTGGKSTSTAPNDIVVGSWSAWQLTFDDENEPTVEKISDLGPETALSNGITSVPNAVLLADSYRGSISRLDLSTGDYEDEIISAPEMVTTPDFELGIGINGIQIHGSHLYFSNSALASIYRLRITPAGYSCSPVELVSDISSIAEGIDDFAIDEAGNIYATTNYINKLVYVDVKTGEFEVLAGGPEDFTVAGSSAAAFGRGENDQGVLYLSTAAATIGNVTEGARILAVEF